MCFLLSFYLLFSRLLLVVLERSVEMKISVFVAFVALLGLAACSNSSWGTIGANDVLIHNSYRKQSFSFLRVVTEDLTFPFSFQENKKVITAIRVTDQEDDGEGFAEITDGGVGFTHVTIHMKSKRNSGFHFFVEIFGRNDK